MTKAELELEIQVLSSDRYAEAFAPIWWACHRKHWPDCPWPTRLMTNEVLVDGIPTVTTGPDLGWCRALRKGLEQIEAPYTLQFLEDSWLGPAPPGGLQYTEVVSRALEILKSSPEVGAIALGGNPPPELASPWWPERLGMYSREHDSVKLATLTPPRLWRTDLLRRLVDDVITYCNARLPEGWDTGRRGAIDGFEVSGNLLLERLAEKENICFLGARRDVPSPHMLPVLVGVTMREHRLLIASEAEYKLLSAVVGQDLLSLPGVKAFVGPGVHTPA